MADAVASVDPAALADVIRRCEAAVASWDLGDIETRAVLGESADFSTAIRDAAPLVLAVERRVRDATRSASSSAAASSPREARVARSAGDDSDETRGSSPRLSPPPTRAASNARRGATVVELCGPERGHVLGWLVRALLPVEAVEEVVLVDRRAIKRPPRREDGDDGATTTTTSDDVDATFSRSPRVTYHRANVKNGSHLRSLARSLRVATHCDNRGPIVFVARRLSGTETLRACQLFDASYELHASDVSVPATLLLEPGDAPPKEESLKGKLLFRIARAHACAARQLYPAQSKTKAAATRRSSDEPEALGAIAAAKHTRDEEEPFVAEQSARRERRDADAAFRFFRHVVAGLRKTPGSFVDEFVVRAGETRETRFAVARRDVAVGDSSDAFGPVARTVTEQMADLNAAVARRLGERGGYVGPEALAALASETPRRASTDAPRADDAASRDTRRPFFAFASPPRLLAGRDADEGADDFMKNVAGFLLRRVSPSRWTEGGYAAEHYVKPDPEPHGVCYEAVGVDARGFETECPYDEVRAGGDSVAARVGLGFVAVAAHERGGAEEEDEVMNSFMNSSSSSSLGRVLTNAQIERLCVKTGARGVGVAQTLLRVADGFHACGVPARVKTASERARASFSKMPSLLRFVGFKDPTVAGVSKARGVRTVVVVDDVDRRPEKKEESDDRRKKTTGGLERSEPVGRFRRKCRWGADEDDARAYEETGWGKKDVFFFPEDAEDANSQIHSCPIDWAVRETTAAMNRAAPDTVDACAARVTRALRGAESFETKKSLASGDDAEAVARAKKRAAAAAAAGAAFARRAAREPTYASTHARVLRRVDSELFREKATETTLQTLRRLSKRADPRETPDVFDAEGAAAFAAALVDESDENGTRTTETERARVAANVAATLSELCDVAETSIASLFALCAAVEHGAFCGAKKKRDVYVATLSEEADVNIAAEKKILARLGSVASQREPDPRVGGDASSFAFPARARFAAERACVKMSALQTRDVIADSFSPIVGHVETRASFAERKEAIRVGFGVGRGRALLKNEPARSRAETHASAVAEAALLKQRRLDTCGNDKKRVPVAPPLTIAVAGSVAAVERGMRQGWVFRYVGSPVAPSDEPYWTR